MAQVKWQVDLTFVPAKYNARNVAATLLHIASSHRKLSHIGSDLPYQLAIAGYIYGSHAPTLEWI